jgi:hypothetical protein
MTLVGDASLHARVKHIDVHFHYIRDCADQGEIAGSYVRSSDNVGDEFTKALDASTFLRVRNCMGLS